jgi:hypothetical protein
VIDVVVTDKRGQPVTGLKQDDFTIKENGKEQTIKACEVHLPGAQPQAYPKFDLAPNVYTNVPAQPLEGSINIVLFDLVNTPITD